MDEPVLAGISSHNIATVLYAGIIVTGVGYFCYLKAIELSGPSNASVAFFIKPVIAVILAALILSEPVTVNIVVGVFFILAGFFLNAGIPKKTHASGRKIGNRFFHSVFLSNIVESCDILIIIALVKWRKSL